MLRMHNEVFILLLCSLSLLLSIVDCSIGDQSRAFNECFATCVETSCLGEHFKQFRTPPKRSLENTIPLLNITVISCRGACQYECMWYTVKAYQHYYGIVPQFHGKWPFIHLMGIQEPASAIFSLLNFAAHLYAIIKFIWQVPRHAPMFLVWFIYGLFCLNAWMSSTIFHTYDTSITEKMDYFGALSFLLCSLFALIIRFLGSRKVRRRTLIVIGIVHVVFFLCHISYLSFVKFDYGYNMAVNVTIGALNGVGWITWCVTHRRQYPYVNKCIVVMVMLNALVLLELIDFPPLFWTFDAHSLWHAGTIPLGIIFFSFLTDDCLHLLQSDEWKLKRM